MGKTKNLPTGKKLIIKKCHVCGHISESQQEIARRTNCNKSFLPTNYFGKIHAKTSKEFNDLFSSSTELTEEDLVKGIQVIW